MEALYVRRAKDDILSGLARWRVWWLLGIGDIRQRYARSRLGQFWITLSQTIFIVAIGTVYSLLFNQSLTEYLPYLATNFVVWALMAGIIGESATVFTQAESFLRQEPLPKTVFVMRLLVRNSVFFAHNVVIIPAVFLAVGLAPSWTWLLVPVGIALILAAGFFTGLLLGVLCTRFRDLPQVVTNILQVAFFITPVTWPEAAIARQAPAIIELNPFAAFLRLAAEPMRGVVPHATTYAFACLTIVALAALSLPLFARFRPRIVYWL